MGGAGCSLRNGNENGRRCGGISPSSLLSSLFSTRVESVLLVKERRTAAKKREGKENGTGREEEEWFSSLLDFCMLICFCRLFSYLLHQNTPFYFTKVSFFNSAHHSLNDFYFYYVFDMGIISA